MFGQILSASNNWVALAILGAFFVIMIVMTIVPQKKRQKQMQNMMDNLTVGDKVMTIGRLIGKIVAIDTDNKQVTINVGTDDSETLIVIDRNAVGYVVDSVNKPAASETPKKENLGILGKRKHHEDVEIEENTNDISIEGDNDISIEGDDKDLKI